MKTVKRYAKVGESILIKTKAALPWETDHYNGEVLLVTETEGKGNTLEEGEVLVEGKSDYIRPSEYEVVVPESEGMKTEKRHAKEGESIIITDAWSYSSKYKNGDRFDVEHTMENGFTKAKGVPVVIVPYEYEVITEEDEPNAEA